MRHRTWTVGLFFVPWLVACAGESGSLTFAQSWGPLSLEAGQEDDSQCLSWNLQNDAPVYVNSVEMAAGPGFHHSNWFFLPADQVPGPDGIWNCADRNFNSLTAAVVGGVLYAQSTQAQAEIQAFQPGVAIPLPPNTAIVGQVHLLNASSSPLSTEISLNVTAIPERDVTVRLSPFALDFSQLTIPPLSRSSFTSACDFESAHQQFLGRALDMKIYYVLPHYHALGEGLSFGTITGTTESTIFEANSTIGEPLGGTLDPPFDTTGIQNLQFSCHYNNPRDVEVGSGIGDQEMCIVMAFTDSEYTWAGYVQNSWSVGQDVNNVNLYEGDCTVFGLPTAL